MITAVYRVPLRTRFRGIDVRDGVLVRGPAGWGEFSPFWDYDDAESRRWWASAVESAVEGWPAPVRFAIPVNVTVPAVGAEQAHAIVSASGCRTAKVKVAEPGQSPADDLARVEAVRDALGPAGAIRVDANAAWDVDTAVARIAELDRVELEYVEQPCATLEELAALRRRIDVRIAADEVVRRSADPLRVDLREACDVVVLKVQPLGGVRARGGRGARPAVRRLVGAGKLGRDRRRGRAGRGAAGAAVRLRAGHRRAVHR